MKLKKVHFCCHFALAKEADKKLLDAFTAKLVEKPIVVEKFSALGQVPSVALRNTYGEWQLQIGPEEEEPISISFFQKQIAFCFSADKKYEPTENDVYTFVGKIIGQLPRDLVIEGYILKAVGILDELQEGYLERVGRHFLSPSMAGNIDQLSAISLEEPLEISGQNFKFKYEFLPFRLGKSKREILQIKYDLRAAKSKAGFSSVVLKNLFMDELSRKNLFGKLLEEKLPHG